LDHKPHELLIEGIVRTVGCAGYKSGSKSELSPGNLFRFVVCELASTHPAEYAVFVVVRHSFSFPVFFDFLLQTRWKSIVETKHGSKKRLQNKVFWFNGTGSILLFRNPKTERGMVTTTRGVWRDCSEARCQSYTATDAKTAKGIQAIEFPFSLASFAAFAVMRFG